MTASPQLLAHVANLPTSPGVYLFYRDDCLLYVGKSINIRQRVRSHLAAAKRGGKERRYVSAATHVECISRPNELSALLLESQLIKAHTPLYNKRLRRTRDLWSWQLAERPEDARLGLTEHQWPPPAGVLQWGLYRNRTQAHEALRELCREARLCEQTLGLTKGDGACFNRQLGRCDGVCEGLEAAEVHDQRLRAALINKAHNHWPFETERVATQHCADSPAVSVLQAWHYLGDFESVAAAENALGSSSLTPSDTTNTPIALDLDAFRIVVSYLRQQEAQGLLTFLRPNTHIN